MFIEKYCFFSLAFMTLGLFRIILYVSINILEVVFISDAFSLSLVHTVNIRSLSRYEFVRYSAFTRSQINDISHFLTL